MKYGRKECWSQMFWVLGTSAANKLQKGSGTQGTKESSGHFGPEFPDDLVLLCVCRVPVQIAGRALGWSLRLRLGSWVFTLLGYHPIQFSHCFEGTVVPTQSSLGPLGTRLPHTPNPWPFSFGGRGHRGGRYVSATRVNTPGDKWEKENPGTSVPMAKFLA